ncbi:MAG: DUF4127 family protein [Bacillota bacterium]|nr:DUF4127 family protein [Bacillota bacterium]
MRKLRGVLSLLLVLLFVCSCGIESSEPVIETEPEENLPKIAYVPLDDRPNNARCMEYMAQSLGYELLMPDADLYATRLNNQPLNANGSTCGDRAALCEWLVRQEEEGCDRYIIFADQLLSGGLVSSRDMSENEPVTLSDGRVMTETELLDGILALLGSDSKNKVFLLDTVMRLAPTVGYDKWTMEDYTNVRAWACVPRAECEMTPEAIAAGYCTDAKGEYISPEDYGVSEETLSKYLQSRERKLQLSSYMLESLEGDVFRVLMGIDDSSEESCIQKNEIEYFESRLGENDALLSGVDDMAYKALAKMYLEDIAWQGSEAQLCFFGDNEDRPASAYDFRALNEILADHFEYFGLKETEDAELIFAVLTAPRDEGKKSEYLDACFDAIEDAFEDNKAVVLMDASNGAYGEELRDRLIEDTELGKLVSYAGTLDLANLTGVALSHGVSRYALLKNGGDTEYTQRGYERCMADVLVKDLCYRTVIRAETAQYVRDMGGNPDNFYDPEIDENAVLDFTVQRMEELAPEVLDNLRSSNFICSLAPYTEAGWGGIELTDYCFNWHRTFEFDFNVYVGNATDLH